MGLALVLAQLYKASAKKAAGSCEVQSEILIEVARKITKSCLGFSYTRDSEVALTESLGVRSAIQEVGEFDNKAVELL